MHCLKCGAKIEEGKFYCGKCGGSIQLVPDYNPLEDYLQNEIAGKSQKKTSKPKKKSSKKIKKKSNEKFAFWLIVTILLAIAVIIGFLFIYFINDYDYQMKSAKSYIKEEKYKSAIRCLENALSIKKDEIEPLICLGEAYLGLEQDQKGIGYLKKAIDQDRENMEAYKVLLMYYEEQGEMETIGILMEKAEDSVRNAFPQYVADPPVFLTKEGVYNRTISVAVSSGKGTVYYTLNSKTPIAGEVDIYMQPIIITEGEWDIRAIFVNEKGVISSESVGRYEIISH